MCKLQYLYVKNVPRYNSAPSIQKESTLNLTPRESNELALFNLPKTIAHLHCPGAILYMYV
jgi:hypothetical protein